jgi:hypothetical protein
MRGGRKPAVVDLNSKMEDACGVIEVLLMPICANALVQNNTMAVKMNTGFNINTLLNSRVRIVVLNMVSILGDSL